MTRYTGLQFHGDPADAATLKRAVARYTERLGTPPTAVVVPAAVAVTGLRVVVGRVTPGHFMLTEVSE